VSCTCMLCSWVGGLDAFVFFFSPCALGRASGDFVGDVVVVVLTNQFCQ